MPFPFKTLCELLEDLDANRVQKALPRSAGADPDLRTITTWFNAHHNAIPRKGSSAVAFLSCLFPERRVDRVYGLKEKRLSRALGRCLCLGDSRRRNFEHDIERGKDIGECVFRVLREAELPRVCEERQVTLEEIDVALDQVAAGCQFSSPDLRRHVLPRRPDEVLEPIFQRLQSREAKWLTRMILKDFAPVIVPEAVVMGQYHFLLYDLLAFQDSFIGAVEILQHKSIVQLSPRQPREYVDFLKKELAYLFVPQVNIFFRRQLYDKARSIKHCCTLANRRQMSVERKYDGEYCQIHIDVSKNCPIRIFSKSGKESTMDRVGVHDSLKKALKIGQYDCLVASQCILEGELLVWNDFYKSVQPFRMIRKHVSRSGRFIGVEQDSPVHADDHLMIMLYDVMLWDDVICIKQPLRQRRRILEGLVTIIPGRVDIAKHRVIDFRRSRAPEEFRVAFAQSITQRWEGLVLKGMDDPYSVLSTSSHGIKLKKDYIVGIGDTEDFVVLGGRFNEQEQTAWQQAGIDADLQGAKLEQLMWTTFHLGCLENKQEVIRWNAKPSFRVVGTVGIHCISKQDIVLLNQLGQFYQTNVTPNKLLTCYDFTIDQPQMPQMTTAFDNPFIVEVMGAGFERPAGVNYPMLRFPRIQKLHEDRSLKDTIGLDELREKAILAESLPIDCGSQEDARWIERLVRADGRSKYINEQSQLTTPGRSAGSKSPSKSSLSPLSPEMVRIDTPLLDKAQAGENIHAVSPCLSPIMRKRRTAGNCCDIAPDAKRGRSSVGHSDAPVDKSQHSPMVEKLAASRPLAEICNGVHSRDHRNHTIRCAGASDDRRSESRKPGKDQGDQIAEPSLHETAARLTLPTSTTRGPQILNRSSIAANFDLLTPLTSSEQPSSPLQPEGIDITQTNIRECVASLEVGKLDCKIMATNGCDEMLRLFRFSVKSQAVLPLFLLAGSPGPGSALHLLERSKGSLTFSQMHFLRNCVKILRKTTTPHLRPKPVAGGILHISLIDEANMAPDLIGKTTIDLVGHVNKLVKNAMQARRHGDLVEKHALMFLDWKALALLEGSENPDAKKDLKPYFWGGFLWPIGGKGQVGCSWDFSTIASWLSVEN